MIQPLTIYFTRKRHYLDYCKIKITMKILLPLFQVEWLDECVFLPFPIYLDLSRHYLGHSNALLNLDVLAQMPLFKVQLPEEI